MSSLARVSIHLVAVVSAGPPLGGLYLKPPSSGGLWLGVMTMPSAGVLAARGVVFEDGVGEDGGGGVAELVVDEDGDVVGREDFEGGGEGGLGEGVGVLGEEEGAGGVLGGAVLDDGLGDGEDVRVVEAVVQRAASMA